MIGFRFGIGIIVADVFVIFRADLRIIEVIDEGFRQFFVFRPFGNSKGVRPDDGAFFGNNEGNVWIIFVGKRSVAGPHGADPGFFGDEFLLDGVGVKGEEVGDQFVEMVDGLCDFVWIFRVYGMPVFLESHADDFTVVVEQNDTAFVFVFPQIIP